MAELINQLFEFVTSDRFQAFFTWVSWVIIAVTPIIVKVIKIKNTVKEVKRQAQLQKAESENTELKKENSELKAVFVEMRQKQLEFFDEFRAWGNGVTDAQRLAFDRSNLKEDVKSEIGKMLKPIAEPILNAEKIINVSRTALQEDEKKFDDTLPTQTPIEKPKPKRVF